MNNDYNHDYDDNRAGERNYHVFYQVLAGADKASLNLEKGASSFWYLNQSGDSTCMMSANYWRDLGEISAIYLIRCVHRRWVGRRRRVISARSREISAISH